MTATSIPALLEPIQERLDAATPGPWEPMRAGLLGTRVVAIDGEWGEGIIPPEFIHMVTPAMRNYDTAVFIAAAPTDTARLLAAVKAVDSILSQALTMISADPDVSEYERGFDDSTRGLSAKLRSAVEAALGEA